MAAQESSYLEGAPLGNVSLYQSARIEIGKGHRSSRSSRIVSDKGFPLMRTGERQIGIGPRFKAGRNIPSASNRRITASTFLYCGSGLMTAIGFPRSVKTTSRAGLAALMGFENR